MKFLKMLGLFLVGIIVLAVVVSFFLDSSIKVERTMEVKAPANFVYANVIDYNKWTAWNPWPKQDSTMKSTVEDSDLGKGSVQKWTSTQNGGGSQRLLESKPGTYIKSKLNFDDFEGDNFVEWKFDAAENGNTLVTWTFEGAELPFYMRLMGQLFIKGAIEASYDQGLADLKLVVEPEEVATDEMYIACYTDTLTIAALDTIYAYRLGMMAQWVDSMGVKPLSMPLCMTHKWMDDNDPSIIMALGFQVPEKIEVPQGMDMVTVPAGKAVHYKTFGDYSQLETHYNRVLTYMKDNNLEAGGSPWEVYTTDPGLQPDTTLWETDIYFPI